MMAITGQLMLPARNTTMLRLKIGRGARRWGIIGAGIVLLVVAAVLVSSSQPHKVDPAPISGFAGPSARAAFIARAPHFSANDSCGAVKFWANPGAGGTGFPAVNTGNCQAHMVPAQPAALTWKPIVASKSVCEDWVIYHTNRTGHWELFRSGKSNQPESDINLSRSLGANGADTDNAEPSLSPDRQWVAFASNRDGTWGIYAASTDGKQLQRVTQNAFAISLSPAWAPDGHALVYESASSGIWNLTVFDVGSGKESVLTDTPASDIDPYWSPDSQHIVFESARSGSWQIYVLDVASQQVTMVSDGQGNDYNPMYSPDGKQILYRAMRPSNEQNGVLYVMNADGSNPKAISDTHHNASNQAWSPDGTLIAYQSNQSSEADIFVYQPATQKTRQVTASLQTAEHYAPTWRCDSKTLVFTSDVSGTANLYSAPALPIDAPPINVKADATPLTSFNTASAQFPVSSPGQIEEASRLKLLPGITSQGSNGQPQ